MKIYRSVLFALLCCGHVVVSAQLKEYLTAACEPLDYHYLMDQLENFPKNDSDSLIFDYLEVYRRQITPTYDELLIFAGQDKNLVMWNGWCKNEIHINIILSRKNEMAYCQLAELTREKMNEEFRLIDQIFFEDSTAQFARTKQEFQSIF